MEEAQQEDEQYDSDGEDVTEEGPSPTENKDSERQGSEGFPPELPEEGGDDPLFALKKSRDRRWRQIKRAGPRYASIFSTPMAPGGGSVFEPMSSTCRFGEADRA